MARMRLFPGLVVLLLAVTLAGCPRPIKPGDTRFISADPGSQRDSGWFNLPTGADGAGEEVEEREVVEPDVIRRDGELLYVLNQYRGLSIVNLDTETLLAQVPAYGYPRDLYLVGDRAYVIVAAAGEVTEAEGLLSFAVHSRLYVVDVADPARASIIGSFDLDGDLVDSRLVGNVLYAISAEYQWYWGGDGVAVKQQESASWVTSINVADPDAIVEVDRLSFAGYGNVIQATNFALFVAAPDWQSGQTAITYIDISDAAGGIAVRGGLTVPGEVADRFKMDAYGGVLRVVSNTWWPNRDVYVTTVSLADPDNLAVLGAATIENATGETLFATRFDGPRAYVVTFLVVDPLFVLDLSDPANPVVAGELKVPGWSTHIEPQGDRLVALGVDDTGGQRRVSVSLFDVAVPEDPQLVERVSFGEQWAWSSAYQDVKAFTVLDDVLIVPFSGWNEAGGFDRLQFIHYTRDSLELGAHVDLQGQILRSFDYGGAFYGVTTEQVAVIEGPDLGQLAATRAIGLAEYVRDFHELAPSLAAKVVSHFDSRTTEVRTLDDAGLPLGSASVDMPDVLDTFAWEQSVVLVATVWDEKPRYVVAKVDCADPAAPVVSKIEVDVEPYYGWWYGWWDMPMGRPGVAVDALIAPGGWWWPPVSTGDSVMLSGDYLALRCRSRAESTPANDTEPRQGVAVIGLPTLEWARTIDLGDNEVVSLHADENTLYLTTKRPISSLVPGRARSAYYVRTLDPATGTAGPDANVPGDFLDYDPAAGLLLTQDRQYRFDGGIEHSLKSLSWDGGTLATLIDSFVLPDSHGEAITAGDRVYVPIYGGVYRVQAVRVGADGALDGAGIARVTEQWAYLEGAQGTQVYVTVGGRAIARYDFSGEPVLRGLTPVMASPLALRFGTDAAYAPLGYAGLAYVPLDAP